MKTAIIVLCVVGALVAQDKPTSLAEARTAVEANMSTPEGKAYDQLFGKEFLDKHLSTMRQCKQPSGNDSFWTLMKLARDGAAQEVLFYPTTRMATCARETLLKSKFSAPPRPGYWVSVYFKISH